jgi:hypothetical protein
MIIAPKYNKQLENLSEPATTTIEGIPLPSLEEIEQMERLRSQAVEALQISDNSVKCQRCSNDIPIVGKLGHHHNNDRIAVLQNRIKYLETHYHGHRFGGSTDTRDENIKALKQELAELLAEDAAYDKLRNLPLYKFVQVCMQKLLRQTE